MRPRHQGVHLKGDISLLLLSNATARTTLLLLCLAPCAVDDNNTREGRPAWGYVP